MSNQPCASGGLPGASQLPAASQLPMPTMSLVGGGRLAPASSGQTPGPAPAAPIHQHGLSSSVAADLHQYQHTYAELENSDEDNEDDEASEAGPSSAKKPRVKGNEDSVDGPSGGRRQYFSKELRCMLYGLGDSRPPYKETVELLDALVVDYIRQMTVNCMQVGKRGKVALEDVWYLTRRDARKYARVKDLLSMNEELRRARKAFDEAKY